MLKNKNYIKHKKLDYVSYYIEKQRNFQKEDSTIKSIISLLPFLFYKEDKNLYKNYVISLLKDILNLIEDIENDHKVNENDFNSLFLKKFIINETRAVLESKNIFNIECDDFTLKIKNEALILDVKSEYLNFILKESKFLYLNTNSTIKIQKKGYEENKITSYQDYLDFSKNLVDNKINENLRIVFNNIEEEKEDFNYINQLIQEEKNKNMDESYIKIKEIIIYLESSNIEFINLNSLLELHIRIKNVLKKRTLINVKETEIPNDESLKLRFITNNAYNNIFKNIFIENINKKKTIELFLDIKFDLENKRKITIDSSKIPILKIEFNLNNDNYVIKLYNKEIRLDIIKYENFNLNNIKNINKKIKIILNTFDLKFKFTPSKLFIGKEEFKFKEYFKDLDKSEKILNLLKNNNKNNIKLIYKLND